MAIVGRCAGRLGRPSLPLETYLRLMFLKFRCHGAVLDLNEALLAKAVGESPTTSGASLPNTSDTCSASHVCLPSTGSPLMWAILRLGTPCRVQRASFA